MFIIVGILGLVTEIRNLNANYNIAGVDNIVSGLILLILSYLLKTFINPDNWINFASRIYELLLFFLILFSIYDICRGVIEMCYSIYKDYREKKKNGKLFSSVMADFNSLFGLHWWLLKYMTFLINNILSIILICYNILLNLIKSSGGTGPVKLQQPIELGAKAVR